MAAETETITIRRDDLELLLKVCACYAPHPPADDISETVQRTLAELGKPASEAPEAEPLPDGFFGRVELPGWRNHTGWITEETKFGAQVAVVRDWNGAVVAEVCIGPMCQVVHLPTPLKRPDPAALPPGAPGAWAGEVVHEEDEDPEGYDGTCGCGDPDCEGTHS